MSSCLYSRKDIHRKKHELKTKWSLSCFLGGSSLNWSTSLVWVCFSPALYTMMKTKSTRRTSSGHSFLAMNIFLNSNAIASANLIFRAFPKACNSQTEWKTTVDSQLARLGSKLTNQKIVVFPERSSLWIEKETARLKYTKWLDHWKLSEEINSVNLWWHFSTS